MKGTQVSGTYSQLFEGSLESVIQCLNVNYESSRRETFNCLQLPCESGNIEEAFRKYCESEMLINENQYDAGDLHGK